MIFEIGARVGASGQVKGASEAFVINQSIIERRSETEKEDIMTWEGGRAWASERLIVWEGPAMRKIESRMEDLGMWVREGSEGIGSS
jgi:hypothetical protein